MKYDNDNMSLPVTDEPTLIRFLQDPGFPFLVSYGRTGSHWLRFLMELYFEKPSLQRIFYYFDAKEFTCFHTHDISLSLVRDNVIYLYRNPIDTVFSQLMYNKKNIDDPNEVIRTVQEYAGHLRKWLIEETFTKNKCLLTYEGLSKTPEKTFETLCRFYQVPFIKSKFVDILNKVTKEKVRNKTLHDRQVINQNIHYAQMREEFRNKFQKTVQSEIKKAGLSPFFNKGTGEDEL